MNEIVYNLVLYGVVGLLFFGLFVFLALLSVSFSLNTHILLSLPMCPPPKTHLSIYLSIYPSNNQEKQN